MGVVERTNKQKLLGSLSRVQALIKLLGLFFVVVRISINGQITFQTEIRGRPRPAACPHDRYTLVYDLLDFTTQLRPSFRTTICTASDSDPIK